MQRKEKKMVTQEVYKNESGKLIIKVNEEGSTVKIDWEGESTDIKPSQFLEPVFKEIFTDVSKNYVVDLTRLKYMNSGTMNPLIRIFQQMEKAPGSLSLWYDAAKKWQELSFDALIFFKTKDGRINIEAK